MINVVTQAQDDQQGYEDYEVLVAQAVLLTTSRVGARPNDFSIVPAVTNRDDALLYMRQSATG
jgi:hypothetical protein